MQPGGSKVFCFEGFTLDLRRGCLRREEREIELRPKSFELLRYLVENAGRLVPKDELVQAIWPSVVVSDESLARCVSDVRLALGDRDQRIIKTVARRGYLFAAPVFSASPTAGQRDPDQSRLGNLGPSDAERTVPPTSRTTSVGAIAGGIILVLAAIAAVGWHLLNRPAPLSPGTSAVVPRLSLVVLPFVNLSGDPAQDYLADVITDELTAGLARIRGSFVIARSTAFTYKGKAVDVKQIGRELGVRYVLEGSEQQSGGQVRVNAQLVSAETGAQMWTDEFDADRADLLTMEDEIVTRLARSLEIETNAIEAARVARVPPSNLDAEDLAMRCRAAFASSTPGSPEHVAAFDLCERALRIDGRNVVALGVVALKYIDRVLGGWSADPKADIRRADDLLTRALAIDPDDYWAHHAKAFLLVTQKRPEEALVEAERSRALNPSFIPAYFPACDANWVLGRAQKTIELANTAIRLSPRDPALWVLYLYKGLGYSMLQESSQAIDMYRRVVAIAPLYSVALRSLAAELALNGQLPEAREALQRYLSLKDVRIRTIAQHEAFGESKSDNPAFRAWLQRFNEGLRQAGMPEK